MTLGLNNMAQVEFDNLTAEIKAKKSKPIPVYR